MQNQFKVVYIRSPKGLFKYKLFWGYYVCVSLNTREGTIPFPEEYPIFW